MSAYTNYYTTSDVSVFIEDSGSGNAVSLNPQVMLDTALSIAWTEQLDSSVIYGIGEQRYGFINSGNVLVSGLIELSFTHDEYLKTVLDSVVSEAKSLTQEQILNRFLKASVSEVANGKLDVDIENFNNFNSINQHNTSRTTGIQNFPQGWNIRVIFNNGNFNHQDENKQFLIKGCKIIGSSLEASTAQAGHISQVYRFLAREIRSGTVG